LHAFAIKHPPLSWSNLADVAWAGISFRTKMRRFSMPLLCGFCIWIKFVFLITLLFYSRYCTSLRIPSAIGPFFQSVGNV
jgi:hypothetical protein